MKTIDYTSRPPGAYGDGAEHDEAASAVATSASAAPDAERRPAHRTRVHTTPKSDARRERADARTAL